MVLIKAGRMGERIFEYIFENGITVKELFKNIDLFLGPDEYFEVNSLTVSMDYKLADGSKVLIHKKVTPTLKIKIGRVGYQMQLVTVDVGTKAEAVLNRGGLRKESNEDIWLKREEFSFKDRIVPTDYAVVAGDVLILERRRRSASQQNLIDYISNRHWVDSDSIEDEHIDEIIRLAKLT